MLGKGSSAVRAGRLLRSLDSHVARLESNHLAIRSLATTSIPFNGRLHALTTGGSVVAVRTFADGAASRPKAHTGRATSTRKPRSTTTKTAGRRQATKKRATKAKPKPKPKKKKVALTPEAKRKNEVRQLKQELLVRPKRLPSTAFLVVTLEQSKGQSGLKPKESSAIYRNLSPSEREHYNHIANENKAKNEETYKRWLHSHSVSEVKRANAAGRRLVRLGARKQYIAIRDDRAPKMPRSARALFIKDRFASGDMAGVPIPEASRLISAEWKQLSSSEQQKYQDEAKRDRDRYAAEVKRVNG